MVAMTTAQLILTALTVITFAAIAFALGWLLSARKHAARLLTAEATAEQVRTDAAREMEQADARLAQATREAETRQELALEQTRREQLTQMAPLREQLAASRAEAARLEQLLEQLRKETAQKADQQQQDSRVLQHLAPVADNLKSLANRLNNLESERARQHGELLEKLKQASRAEQQLLSTSQQLAKALSSAGGQGNWGETALKRLLEAAGMTAHVDFNEQSALRDVEGRQKRPDVVVQLPAGRTLAIDAKAPLSDILNLDPTASNTELKHAQQAHATKLKGHIKALAARDYPESLPHSLELVIAFVPSDALLAHAFKGDPEIYNYGYSQGVVLASPATLLGVLKAIEHSWRQQAVSDEAQQLHALGTELYKRLSSMAEKLDKLGRSINRTVTDYNSFISTVERRVLPQARKINNIDPQLLDAKLAKEMPLLENTANPLASPELTTRALSGSNAAETATNAAADTPSDTATE